MRTDTGIDVPNHHAHYPGFTGPAGILAALTMTIGRDAMTEVAIDLADLSRGDRLVDVGCGPGVAARTAARHGARVVGVDPAPVMLRVARLLTRPGKIEWRQASAEDLGLPDADADVVWSLATVHHWTDVDAGVAEARRVLRPGGRLIAVERRRNAEATGLASHGWTDSQASAFADRCRSAGFTDLDITTHRTRRGALLAVTAVRP